MRHSWNPLRDFRPPLSHWANFTVCIFISVYLCVFCVLLFPTALLLYYCEHGGVDLMGLKSTGNPSDLSSFSHCWLGHLTCETCPRYDL